MHTCMFDYIELIIVSYEAYCHQRWTYLVICAMGLPFLVVEICIDLILMLCHLEFYTQ